MIRILIADDHAIVRHGLALSLKQEPDFEVIAELADGEAAYASACKLLPDIVLLDYKMPRMDGFESADKIRQSQPALKIIILSGAPLEDDIFDQLDNVDGYVHKEISPANLSQAIRTVASGERYFGPLISQAILNRKRAKVNQKDVPSLSQRELEVLQLMATPATYREIAAQLNVADSTVHTYVRRILEKLDASKRTHAVLKGVELGLIE